MSRVLLVRHGETDWNRQRRIQGWAPTLLNERGREQARALGSGLGDEGVDSIVASDLPRAMETAEIIGRELGLTVGQDWRWRERDFGFCQGLDYDEFDGRFPQLSVNRSGRDAVEARPESGETYREMFQRVREAWDELVAETASGETRLIITHGGPLYSLIGYLKGLDLVDSIVELDQDNCAVNEIDLERKPTIVRDNDTDVWR
ncbi:MAG: histidine phosphatase family protein [Halodesulfurarchaeum sp.]